MPRNSPAGSGRRFRVRPPLACLGTAFAFSLLGCLEDGGSPPPRGEDPPWLVVDSLVVLDTYGYEEAVCNELIADGTAANERPSTPWYLQVVATACWKAEIAVVDAAGDTVSTWSAAFGIFDRREGEKERGRQGWIAWDGLGTDGLEAPPGRYLMKITFDFGRSRGLRVDSDLFKDPL